MSLHLATSDYFSMSTKSLSSVYPHSVSSPVNILYYQALFSFLPLPCPLLGRYQKVKYEASSTWHVCLSLMYHFTHQTHTHKHTHTTVCMRLALLDIKHRPGYMFGTCSTMELCSQPHPSMFLRGLCNVRTYGLCLG